LDEIDIDKPSLKAGKLRPTKPTLASAHLSTVKPSENNSPSAAARASERRGKVVRNELAGYYLCGNRSIVLQVGMTRMQ